MKFIPVLLASLLAMNLDSIAQATADDLKKHMADLQAAISAGKTDDAGKMTAAMLPDPARLKKALGDKVAPETVKKVEAFYAGLPKDNAKLSTLLAAKAGQTEIQVHAATTEELAAYAPGTAAHSEFPGAVKELASNGILRPGVKFYEVEFLKPGEDAGMKYHLFFHDGANWTMLGPIWRATGK